MHPAIIAAALIFAVLTAHYAYWVTQRRLRQEEFEQSWSEYRIAEDISARDFARGLCPGCVLCEDDDTWTSGI